MDRTVAKKAQVSHISGGKYVSSDIPCVITPLGEKIFKVNVIATVTDKFVSDSGKYSSITVDDGTGAVRVKAFGADVGMFEKIGKGDLVVVIGPVGEYQGENYIRADIVKTVEPNYKALRRLELLDMMHERKRIVDTMRRLKDRLPEDEMKEYGKRMGIEEDAFEVIFEQSEPDRKPEVLAAIDKLDDGSGAEIGKVFESLELDDNVIERTLDELLSDGYIYEPSAGKFRTIKVDGE